MSSHSRSYGYGLTASQQAALIRLLQTAADYELNAEQARARLCETLEFNAYETFKSLQGAWHSQKGWCSVTDIHSWLASQPHGLYAGLRFEDVAAGFAPYTNVHGELRFEGFTRLTLPKEPERAYLKDIALRPGGGWTSPHHDDMGRVPHMPADVAFRLCQLFEIEIDSARMLKLHQRNLQELLVQRVDVLMFLDSEQGSCAGMGGMVSFAAMRRVLVDIMGALTPVQCEALFRRLKPNGASLLPFEDLCKYLMPAASPLAPWSPRSALEHHHYLASFATPSLQFAPPPLREHYGSPPPFRSNRGISSPRVASPSSNRYGSPSWAAAARAKADLSYRSPTTPLPPYVWGGLASPSQKEDHLGKSMNEVSTVSTYVPSSWEAGSRYYNSPGLTSSLSRPMSPFSSPLASPRRLVSSHAWAQEQSPRASSPTRYDRPSSPTRYDAGTSAWLKASKDRMTKAVLEVMLRQADTDRKHESAKALLPVGLSLEDVFCGLDRFQKGYIADTDLWQLMQDFCMPNAFGSLAALVNEVQLRWPRLRLGGGHAIAGMPGRLSLRESAILFLSATSREFQSVRDAESDEEAKHHLYLLKCSGGILDTGPRDLTPATWSQICRVIDSGARAADELERDRKHLAMLPGFDHASLSDAFGGIADSRLSFTFADLRHAFLYHSVHVSETELNFLWQRYAGPHGVDVSFADFSRQMKSRIPGLSALA